MSGQRSFPEPGEIAPMGQRLVLLDLSIPPGNAGLVQAPPELLADAEQALLVRLLESQAGGDKLGVEIPMQPREGFHAEAVLAVIFQAVRFAAVRELGARRAADRVPDGLDAVHLRRIEREVVVGSEQPDARRATVDRAVVFLEQPGALGQL